MKRQRVGILHPGAMGSSIAATVQNGGCEVWWLPEGRSPATVARAERSGFSPAKDIKTMAGGCDVIISVCPPHAAEDVAGSLIPTGFGGLFVEANAIAPERTRRIESRLEEAGILLVDGGILGLPAWEAGTSTCLYLSGPRAADVARLFDAGPVAARRLDGPVGQASALKMCYAGYTKGLRALLSAVLATADTQGVLDALEAHWEAETAGMPADVRRKVLATSPKAWRWVAEMEEIRDTFEAAGMPPGFHEASADIYRRLAKFRGVKAHPSFADFLNAIESVSGG